LPDVLTFPGLPTLNRKRAVAASALIIVVLCGLALLATSVARQIDRLGASSIDNVQWTLSQMGVELQTLALAVEDGMDQPDALPEVRKRFDIAYSRFETLKAGALFNDLRQRRGFDQAFAALARFMDRSLMPIDGPDAGLRAALPGMRQELRKLIPAAHRLGTIGVEVFAAQADATRAAIKSALVALAVLSFVLLTVLLALVVRLVQISHTTRQRAQEAAATALRLDAVIRASLDPVVTLDQGGRITGLSPAGHRVFGHDEAQMRGQPLSALLAPGQALALPDAGPQRLRVTARHADGTTFPAEVSISAVAAGGRGIFVAFFSDLSAQTAAEGALIQARDTALAGEKAKADLVVLMSHEIRTPLNGMIGTMDLMQGTDLNPQQGEYLRIMADSGRLLMNQVNDILDMARLDSGKAGMNRQPLDLGALIGEVIANQRPASAAQGNDLTFAPAPDCPMRVLGDAGRLRQVLLNLVGNAVKFTRGGRIVIGLDRLASGAFAITVTDTGIGIAPENLARIFDDFVTLDPSFARNAGGTGLGLGIVRRIVTRMGGEITVDSTPGQGSSFRLILPLEVTEALPLPSPTQLHPATPCGMHVLVVEDNDFNRLIVREMLAQDGHHVTEARDGLEGVARAEAELFDLILMDISMPGLDGIEATERLHHKGGLNGATPVLALTAHAMPEDLRRFARAGMVETLLKPLERQVLRQALADHAPPMIDLQALTEMTENLAPDVLADLVDRFLADMDRRLTALAGANPDVALDEAHHMAGSAGVFGAHAMGLALQRLLAQLRAGEPDAVALALPQLTAVWARTAKAYRLGSSARAQASSLR